MKIHFFLPLVSALLVSCDSKPPTDKAASSPPAGGLPIGDYLKVDGDSVLIPSFEIALDVDEKAREKLKADKESILILVYFSGKPTAAAEKKYPEFALEGEIALAKSSLEISSSYKTEIENIKFPKTKYDDLADKNISVLVNVVSARKSSNDNLLDCGIVEGKMSTIMGNSFTIKCKLIGGN